MTEALAIGVLLVVAGILLFLPSIAIDWWQSKERAEDRPPEEGE